jgi:hypothetical protein
MKRQMLLGAGIAALATIGWAGSAAAQPPAAPAEVTPPPPAPVVAEQSSYVPPNRLLLGSGLVALVGSYVPSVLVAASNNNSFDDKLFIPVAGPWMNLAQRPGCGGNVQTACGTEGVFKALLIVDGAFQGLGALATVLGLVTPEKRTKTVVTGKVDKPSVHVTPVGFGHGGYGVAALGNF